MKSQTSQTQLDTLAPSIFELFSFSVDQGDKRSIGTRRRNMADRYRYTLSSRVYGRKRKAASWRADRNRKVLMVAVYYRLAKT